MAGPYAAQNMLEILAMQIRTSRTTCTNLCVASDLNSTAHIKSQVTSHRLLADSEASKESTGHRCFRKRNGPLSLPRLRRLRSHSSSRPAIRHLQEGSEVMRKQDPVYGQNRLQNVGYIPSKAFPYPPVCGRFSPIVRSILHSGAPTGAGLGAWAFGFMAKEYPLGDVLSLWIE